MLQCRTTLQFIYPFYHWLESRLLHFKKLLNALIDIYEWKCEQVSLGIAPECHCQVTDFLILNFSRYYEVILEKCCAICFPINPHNTNVSFLTPCLGTLGTDFCEWIHFAAYLVQVLCLHALNKLWYLFKDGASS